MDASEELFFKEHFYLTKMGPNLWRAYNRKTQQSASPVYNSKEAAINFVIQEQKLELEEAIDELLESGVGPIPPVET